MNAQIPSGRRDPGGRWFFPRGEGSAGCPLRTGHAPVADGWSGRRANPSAGSSPGATRRVPV